MEAVFAIALLLHDLVVLILELASFMLWWLFCKRLRSVAFKSMVTGMALWIGEKCKCLDVVNFGSIPFLPACNCTVGQGENISRLMF